MKRYFFKLAVFFSILLLPELYFSTLSHGLSYEDSMHVIKYNNALDRHRDEAELNGNRGPSGVAARKREVDAASKARFKSLSKLEDKLTEPRKLRTLSKEQKRMIYENLKNMPPLQD